MNCSSLFISGPRQRQIPEASVRLAYPPLPLRVQRIVLINRIENINFLFHHDEYEPGRYADTVELTLGACRKLGSHFVGLFFQE
jgi:hypothetical protein